MQSHSVDDASQRSHLGVISETQCHRGVTDFIESVQGLFLIKEYLLFL